MPLAEVPAVVGSCLPFAEPIRRELVSAIEPLVSTHAEQDQSSDCKTSAGNMRSLNSSAGVLDLVMVEQSKFALCSTEALDGACFGFQTDLTHNLRQSRSPKRKRHFGHRSAQNLAPTSRAAATASSALIAVPAGL